MDELAIRRAVREHYAGRVSDSCCGPGSTASCAAPAKLGVGDTVPAAAPRSGETLVDLGSGTGADVFAAAALVGPRGRAIGVDATPEMVHAAREEAKTRGLENVEFRLGEIERLPVETGTVDVVVSDCVINLSPDKPAVFREAFRVLRPGGRLLVSDVVSQGALPEAVRTAPDAWAACIAGAVPESEYLRMMGEAGFVDVRVVDRHGDLPGLASAHIEARKPPSPL